MHRNINFLSIWWVYVLDIRIGNWPLLSPSLAVVGYRLYMCFLFKRFNLMGITMIKKYYLVLAAINCVALIVSIARADSFGMMIGAAGMIVCVAGLAIAK